MKIGGSVACLERRLNGQISASLSLMSPRVWRASLNVAPHISLITLPPDTPPVVIAT